MPSLQDLKLWTHLIPTGDLPSNIVGSTHIVDQNNNQSARIVISRSPKTDFTAYLANPRIPIKDWVSLGSMGLVNNNAPTLEINDLSTMNPWRNPRTGIFINQYRGLGEKFIQIASELSHLLGKGGALDLRSSITAEPFYSGMGYYPIVSGREALERIPEYEAARERYKQTGYLNTRPGSGGYRMAMREGGKHRQAQQPIPLTFERGGKRAWIEAIRRRPILFETRRQLQNKPLILD